MCSTCSCFASFFQMFQARFQISLLDTCYYYSCLKKNWWKLCDEAFERLFAFHQCSACNNCGNIPQSINANTLPSLTLNLLEGSFREERWGVFLYRIGSLWYRQNHHAKSRGYFLFAKNLRVPVLENRCSHGQWRKLNITANNGQIYTSNIFFYLKVWVKI